jgi:hypothetical protein
LGYLGPFGIFYGYLVYFSRFGMSYQEKLATLIGGQKNATKKTVILRFCFSFSGGVNLTPQIPM